MVVQSIERSSTSRFEEIARGTCNSNPKQQNSCSQMVCGGTKKMNKVVGRYGKKERNTRRSGALLGVGLRYVWYSSIR